MYVAGSLRVVVVEGVGVIATCFLLVVGGRNVCYHDMYSVQEVLPYVVLSVCMLCVQGVYVRLSRLYRYVDGVITECVWSYGVCVC